ncbi:MAG: hypothetical protein KDD58_04210 [Bdellovibrionales bacterium]|nr:hypothetical protein [Bdellovibrionales bacterium]
MNKFFYYILLLNFLCFPAFAEEKLGILGVEEVLLRPYFLVREGQEAEFGLGESSFALSWFKTKSVGGIIRLGSMALRNPMLHFTDTVDDEVAIVEAFAQISGIYGRLRMGLIPIEFGVEGSWLESELYFNRNLIFEKRIIPLRDFGISYQVGNHGFYTRMAVHNGESFGENPDGRMFLTASWGWTNYRNFNLGVSAMTGTTKPVSTQNVNEDFIAGVDVNKEALWRMADLYLHWHPHKWFFLAEIIFAELEQEEQITKFNGGHLDFGYQWIFHFATFVRYDHLDPNELSDNDLQRKISAALRFSDKHQTQSLYLVASKIYEQGSNFHNDEARLIWHLTPILKTK